MLILARLAVMHPIGRKLHPIGHQLRYIGRRLATATALVSQLINILGTFDFGIEKAVTSIYECWLMFVLNALKQSFAFSFQLKIYCVRNW